MTALGDSATNAMRIAATLCGAAAALLYFSLLVWTARDVATRTRDRLIQVAAVALVLVLNVLGLVVYLLLRPPETIAERYERELVEEILARELTTATARTGSPGARGSADSGTSPGA